MILHSLLLTLQLTACVQAQQSPRAQPPEAEAEARAEAKAEEAAWPAATFAPTLLPVDKTSGLSVLTIDPAAQTAPHVVILALHGLGDRPEQFVSLARPWAGGASGAATATVLVPAAPDAWGQGGSWFSIRARNDGPDLASGVAAAADRLADLLSARTVPSDHVVVTGFSQGGMLTYGLAVLHPDLVDLAVPVSGLLPVDLRPQTLPSTAPPLRALHGAADQSVPVAAARATVAALQALGWDASIQTYPDVGHAISPDMRQRLDELVVAQP